jgi:putative membrane protein
MSFNLQTLVLINLIVQILLMVAVFVAAYIAKVKRQLIRHCTIMRVAVIVQIVTIVVFMLPPMLGFIRNDVSGLIFRLEVPVHHVLGLVVVALWIYINIAFKRIIKTRARLVLLMRLAFISWLVTLILGLHIYLLLRVGV